MQPRGRNYKPHPPHGPSKHARKPVIDRFSIDSCVCGYHVYKKIYGILLYVTTEFGNIHDQYAVIVFTPAETTVGHVPRNISAVCPLIFKTKMDWDIHYFRKNLLY